MCNPDDRECAITTRVNVMLRDVPALGQWLLVSKGFYAAVTLPPAAELLAQAGGYVAGWLGMEEKTAIVKDKPARFMVPTLDVEITPAALMAGQITGGGQQAVASGPEPVAITSGRPDYAALAAVAETAEAVGKLWTQANQAGHLDDDLAKVLKDRAAKLGAPTKESEQKQPEQRPSPDPTPDAEGVYDVEIVDPAAAQDVWFQIIAAAGPRSMTTEQVETAFAQRHNGLHPSSANVSQLEAFLTALKAGEIA
jgi:hypothetical protein